MPAEGLAILQQVDDLLHQFLDVPYDTPVKDAVQNEWIPAIESGMAELSQQDQGQEGMPADQQDPSAQEAMDPAAAQGQPEAGGVPPAPDQGVPPDQGGGISPDLLAALGGAAQAPPEAGGPQGGEAPPPDQGNPKTMKGARQNALDRLKSTGSYGKKPNPKESQDKRNKRKAKAKNLG